mgnify:CR=1 FL=1
MRPGAERAPRACPFPCRRYGPVTPVASVGVLQPVVVRASGDLYVLIAGERRCRAARLAGLEEIPAIIKPADTDDTTSLAEALIENRRHAPCLPQGEIRASGSEAQGASTGHYVLSSPDPLLLSRPRMNPSMTALEKIRKPSGCQAPVLNEVATVMPGSRIGLPPFRATLPMPSVTGSK